MIFPHSPLFNHLKQIGALRLNSPGCRWVPELHQEQTDLLFENGGKRLLR